MRLATSRQWSPSRISTLPADGANARMIAIATVVLPEPDSPTMPRHSPAATSKLTSSTAVTILAGASSEPCLRRKRFTRPSTRSSGVPRAAAQGAPNACGLGLIGRSGTSGSVRSKVGTAASSAFR